MHRHLVRHLTYPLHEWLKGKDTLSRLSQLERTQYAARADLEAIQMTKLRRLLDHAHRTVPYYRQLFDDRRIRPDDITSVADYAAIPCLTKSLVREHAERMRSTADTGRHLPYTTGGSTGEPMKFVVDRRRVSAEWAANWRARRWWGVNIGDRMMSVWASPIEASAQTRLKTLRDRLLNTQLISALNLDAEAVPGYLQRIRRFKTDYLFGYASCLTLLAKTILDRGLSPPGRLKAIFTTGDTLFEHHRRLIETAFQTRVGIEYGARDGGFIAHECPHGGLHIFEEGMVVEVLDRDGRPAKPDHPGEIVLTILDTRAMPFLRYRIGDIGYLSSRPCPCGVTLRVLGGLVGRVCDNLIRADGSTIHGPALANILLTNPLIERYQIIQTDYARVTLKIVSAHPLSAHERHAIQRGFDLAFGQPTTLHIERVGEIPASASGKTRYIINQIAI
ncbi:MAG: phenylacetate--CoA ligase family protein [Nitrospirota bacterium]